MEEEIVEVMSREAELRKSRAAEKANQPLPDFIRSIESTAVVYTMSPKLLPFTQLDADQFLTRVQDEFKTHFRSPKYDPNQLMAIGINPQELTEERILKFMLGGDNPQLAFKDGRYKTGSNKFVVIKNIEIGYESLGVEVEGITDIAEDVVSQIFNIFWQCCNADASWDSEEIKNKLQQKQYKTITNVDLGSETNSLLNPSTKKFLDENLFSNSMFGKKMLPYSHYEDFKPCDDWVGSWSLEDFDFTVAAFNSKTLRNESTTIRFITSTKDDRGRGVLKIQSTLPYEDHVDFISSLIKGMSA